VAENEASIDLVLTEFLADQQDRLAARTLRNYADVVGLLRDCLNGYGYESLDPVERGRWEVAFERGEDAFVHLFGSDKIVENLGEFVGYFMIRKVAVGQELLRAAGTVTAKLASWLGERGYLDPAAVGEAAERGREAARELPKAEKLAQLLFERSRAVRIDADELGDEDYVEDYLMIDKVEPGALWFEGGIGPVTVPKTASNIAQPGWSVNISLGRAAGTWHTSRSATSTCSPAGGLVPVAPIVGEAWSVQPFGDEIQRCHVRSVALVQAAAQPVVEPVEVTGRQPAGGRGGGLGRTAPCRSRRRARDGWRSWRS
jgi:hypothetical protein